MQKKTVGQTKTKKPWERANPTPKSKRTKLTADAKRRAKARAQKAGRAYPNLVDNMWAARTQKS